MQRPDEEPLPRGTVTLLLTDIEASTAHWESRPAEMAAAMVRHDDILHSAIAAGGGQRPVDQGEGDSVVAAFAHARDAVATAVDAQRALQRELPMLAVRMAIHTGDVQLRNDHNYAGCGDHSLRACPLGRTWRTARPLRRDRGGRRG